LKRLSLAGTRLSPSSSSSAVRHSQCKYELQHKNYEDSKHVLCSVSAYGILLRSKTYQAKSITVKPVVTTHYCALTGWPVGWARPTKSTQSYRPGLIHCYIQSSKFQIPNRPTDALELEQTYSVHTGFSLFHFGK